MGVASVCDRVVTLTPRCFRCHDVGLTPPIFAVRNGKLPTLQLPEHSPLFMFSSLHTAARVVLFVVASSLLSACSQDGSDAPQNGGPTASSSSGGRPAGPPGANGRSQQAPVVLTAVAVEKEFKSGVEALGTAKANEAIDITAKVSSRITAIRFQEGQYVKRGEVLVELDTDEARADLAVAEAALGESRSQVNRSRELAVTKALSAQQLEQLEATFKANEARVASARARLNELIIRAPFSGRVGLRNASVGGLVGPNNVITTLDDTSVMKLDFAVPETFIAGLRTGQEIQATSASYAEQTFRGRVISVGSRVDPVTRSIVVRAQVPNKEGRLKPGMFMTVNLVRESGKALVIPEQALVPDRDKQYVFALRDGKAFKTEIVVGSQTTR